MSGNSKLAQKYTIETPTHLAYDAPILVVEDQTDLRLIVVHQLRKMTYSNVVQATNGYEAIERMKEEGIRPEAIICDMDMPVMGGLDLLEELQEDLQLTRAPFCVTMDSVSKDKIMLAVEKGCESVLVKPYTLGDIRPKMLDAFRKFHNPNNPEKLYETAKRALRDEKFDIAQHIFTDLAKTAQKAARPVVGLARLAALQGNDDDALKLLELAQSKNAHYVHLYAERGKLLVKRQAWAEAIEAFSTAIELSPLNPMRYKEAADALFHVRRYDEAVKLLESALSHELEFPDLFHYLSQAKFALKDYKLAAKYIRSALAKDEENITYLNQLGICLKELGETDAAQQTYNAIIKLDPTNVAALYNKSILLKARGQVDEAIKLLDRLIRKHPDFKPAIAKREEYEKERNKGAA